MKKKAGSVLLPKKGMSLQYYVFGNGKEGFGIQIIQYRGEHVLQNKVECRLTHDFLSAYKFAHSLARGAVFPDNLSEICEDYKLSLLIDS